MVGTCTHFVEHPRKSCKSRDVHGASTTDDETVVGPGRMGKSPVTEYVGTLLDTSRILKGSMVGHTFTLSITIMDKAHDVPHDDHGIYKVPAYSYIHVGNFTGRVTVPIASKTTKWDYTSEKANENGTHSYDKSTKVSGNYRYAGETCYTGPTNVTESAENKEMKKVPDLKKCTGRYTPWRVTDTGSAS